VDSRGGREDAPRLGELLARLGARTVAVPLLDTGARVRGAAPYNEVIPTTLAEVQDVVGAAFRQGVPLRIRGRGHSMTGASLPRSGELLLRTEGLRGHRFLGEGAVVAGAGLVLDDLRRIVEAKDLRLPVHNAGGPGPTVGGFLAAGGFGEGSARHGGFWETVLEVTLVDGTGKVRRVRPGERLFPWLFGSMGQLGVFVETTIRLVRPSSRPPVGTQEGGAEGPRDPEGPYWLTLFVRDERLPGALADLESLRSQYATRLSARPVRRYPVRFLRLAAPLVFPEDTSFTALFTSWTIRPGAGSGDLEGLVAELDALVARTPGYRRYVQSDLRPRGFDHSRYFGGRVFARFAELKRELDPQRLLNRGEVFPEP
jgi:FAD/FMN-containing dehydrogenase